MTEETTLAPEAPVVSARESELRTTIEAFLISYHQYIDLDADHITSAFSDAVESLIEIWDCGRTGSMNNATCQAYYKMLGAWQDFNEMGTVIPDIRFFGGIEEMEEAIKKLDEGEVFKSEMPPESMSQFVKEGLTHEQIAKQFGLIHPWPDGRVRVDLVQKEIDTPRSVLTEDYVHPADLIKKRKLATAKAHMKSIIEEEEIAARVTTKLDEGVCPESSYELWQLGRDGGAAMGLTQASNMLKQAPEEVAADWAKFADEATALAAKKKEEPKVSKEMKDARKEAIALGLGVNDKMSLEDLKKRIAEAKAKAEAVA